VDVGAQLGAGKNLHPVLGAGGQRFGDALDGVVVRQAQGLDPRRGGFLDGLGGRTQTVRAEGMGVQIRQIVLNHGIAFWRNVGGSRPGQLPERIGHSDVTRPAKIATGAIPV
jgi:hypothetical protein